MKVLITENKMVNLYQSLIDKCISELIEVAYQPDNIPDWVDPRVLDDIESVDSIKVTDVHIHDENLPNLNILAVYIHVDIVLDSMKYFDVDNLLFHLEYYVKGHTFGRDRGVQLVITADNVDLKNKNPQW